MGNQFKLSLIVFLIILTMSEYIRFFAYNTEFRESIWDLMMRRRYAKRYFCKLLVRLKCTLGLLKPIALRALQTNLYLPACVDEAYTPCDRVVKLGFYISQLVRLQINSISSGISSASL